MADSAPTRVTLERATAGDAVLLSNLMELYVHDLSAMFAHVKLGEDGRYGYPELPSYLSGESTRFAFVIRHEGRVAGFVLARRGSPASDDPKVLDVAEFFVVRQFRARGIGRAAATRLWDLMPGSWTIRASARNPDAIRFWRDTVEKYAGPRATESKRSIGSSEWVVFCFDSALEAAGVHVRD
jgi:predicted acetyltransferase